jgi:hypothetical protein
VEPLRKVCGDVVWTAVVVALPTLFDAAVRVNKIGSVARFFQRFDELQRPLVLDGDYLDDKVAALLDSLPGNQ